MTATQPAEMLDVGRSNTPLAPCDFPSPNYIHKTPGHSVTAPRRKRAPTPVDVGPSNMSNTHTEPLPWSGDPCELIAAKGASSGAGAGSGGASSGAGAGSGGRSSSFIDDSDRRLAGVIADGQHLRPRWHRHAACRGAGLDIFFPVPGASIEPARAICSACPVLAECREWSLDQRDDNGVVAGLSARQRRQLRAERKRGDAT